MNTESAALGDVNGDGLDDILGGGRIHEGNGSKGGVLWIEAPQDPAGRRDLNRWAVHFIDPQQWSGHGSVLADVDADGGLDVTLANHDFDNPAGERTVAWYENPRNESDARQAPWSVHEPYRGDELHTKPQVAVDDLDGDGRKDLVGVLVPEQGDLPGDRAAVFWMRNEGGDVLDRGSRLRRLRGRS